MRFIIIEPFLKNFSGHQFTYTQALTAELENRGIPYLILGSDAADGHCRALKNFYPQISEVTSFAMKMPPWAFFSPRLFGLIKKFCCQLDDFLIQKMKIENEKGDIIFLHTLYIFELIAFAISVRKHCRQLLVNGHKIFIGLNFGYKRDSWFLTMFLAFLYKYVLILLLRKIRSVVIYFSDVEGFKKEFTSLIRKDVALVPVPIKNKFSTPYILWRNKVQVSGGLRLCYVGGARFNKGFDFLVRILRVLAQENEFSKKFAFSIQIDMHRQQTGREGKVVQCAIEDLEKLSGRHSCIKLLYGALSIDEYFTVLAESDAVVLPYRSSAFRSSASNLFREALVLGKVAVVTKGTSMAEEYREHNLSELVFDPDKEDDYGGFFNRLRLNIKLYQEKLKPLQQIFQDYYSDKEHVSALLKLA